MKSPLTFRNVIPRPSLGMTGLRRYFTSPHGSCAAEMQADSAALTSQGLAMTLTSATVASYGGDKATVLATVTVGTKAVSERVYVRYRDDRWWITGGDDSGDLGF